jgi:hypothetical protein
MGAGSRAAERTARFLTEDDEPGCLRLHREGRLAERVAAALRELESCHACPPHFGEEDCLRGWRGSGTIFCGRGQGLRDADFRLASVCRRSKG